MKKKVLRSVRAILLLVPIVVASCGILDSSEHSLAQRQYEFAASILSDYFFFRDKLPPDLYAFKTPFDLYDAVHEPYTAYYDEESAAGLMQSLTTVEGGIGMRCDSVANGYLVKEIFDNSPGKKAGLEVHDTIIRIDEAPTANVPWSRFNYMVSGDIGTNVTLGVKRENSTLNITVTRGPFISPSVFIDSIAPVVVSIMLTGFYDETTLPGGSAEEFRNALHSTEWAEYTIIDLRDNLGGYVGQCISITSELVSEGTPIVGIRERTVNEETGLSEETSETLTATGPGTYAHRKLYLLVDGYTASASEMLVSCLRNRDDVIVIGSRTYGKARGQILFDGPGAVLAKVTAMVILPVGDPVNSYDLVGIIPDIFSGNTNPIDVALNDIENISVAAKRAAGGVRRYPSRREPSVIKRVPAALF